MAALATNSERITIDPGQMGGLACIRGLRIPVAPVLRMLGGGVSYAEVLTDYPDLETEDIQACLRFAAEAASEGELVPRKA